MTLALRGRRKIVTEYKPSDMMDKTKMADAVNTAMLTHILNKEEIDYLLEYRAGVQPILDKTKIVRDEINNKLVANHAQMITRNIIGYFLGTPIQYIQNGIKGKDQLDDLNRWVAYEDKASTDTEIGEMQSITGVGYRVIYTDGLLKDEVPFEEKSLNPSNTFVVYENNVAERPVLAVTYFYLKDVQMDTTRAKMYIYTEFGYYEVLTNSSGTIDADSEMTFVPYKVGGIPIIEYPNNQWRIGDWELCLGLMDAINQLQSGRLDDIDQVVQSLMVFINADIDADHYKEMRESGVVVLKNSTNNPSSVDTVETSLDQSGMKMFSEELESLLYALIGIPDRNNRAGGGGDTGMAVELRDGWADLEIIARNKESVFKKAEKQTLRIILSILKSTMDFNLALVDVDIKFSRNKNNNLLWLKHRVTQHFWLPKPLLLLIA